MCVCVLLGTSATHSKENLMEWLDALVLSVTASDVRVYDHTYIGGKGCMEYLQS